MVLVLGFLAGPLLLLTVLATIVQGVLVLAAAVMSVAAAFALAAIHRALFARDSAREALFGLLALALCVAGPVSAWYGSGFMWPIAGLGTLMWAVLEDILDQSAPATARQEAPRAGQPGR